MRSCPRRAAPLGDRQASISSSRWPVARPGEITLVTLGPLTNLALAVQREPALPRLLRGYALMGGAFGASGNTTPTTEWNMHCDPEAAKIVFALGPPRWPPTRSIPRPVAMGLDVTERARIVPDHVVRIARRAGSTPDDSIALAHGEDPMAPSVRSPAIRSSATSPTPCACTSSSTSATTGSTARSSTIRWLSRPHWIPRWSRPNALFVDVETAGN